MTEPPLATYCRLALSSSSSSSTFACEYKQQPRYTQKEGQRRYDTHWHYDHTDNNANLHAAGATVLAHENTKTRMAELCAFGFASSGIACGCFASADIQHQPKTAGQR
jgi:hypothetical protein